MELNFPQEYTTLSLKDLYHFEGGWSASILGQNLIGIGQKSLAAAAAVRTIAKTFNLETALLKGLNATYSYVASVAGGFITQAVSMIGGVGLGLIALSLTLGAVWVLGEYRLFY